MYISFSQPPTFTSEALFSLPLHSIYYKKAKSQIGYQKNLQQIETAALNQNLLGLCVENVHFFEIEIQI